MRAHLSRRLITEKGFSFVAVEGDWPDCYRINRYIKGYPDGGAGACQALQQFDRWPTWMWANREVAAFATWLRAWNARAPPSEAVGFHGLDVYSLWESLDAVLRFLEAQGELPAAEAARRAEACFAPYARDPQAYASATAAFVPTHCQAEAAALLLELRRERLEGDADEALLDAEQDAHVVAGAEAYYRAMVRGGPESWNVRDRHMVATLDRLLDRHGPDAKAVVWEHNTHVGDARATDMADEGMVNVGQLVREARPPEDVVLVGFGTHAGTVVAAPAWEAPPQRMTVPEARPGSWEDLFHRAGGDRLVLLDELGAGPGVETRRGHRAIGVVYDPRQERWGNYVPTVLPARYDAFLFLDRTRALDPLHGVPVRPAEEPPETWPFGE